MGKLVVGQVVSVYFPFSDLSTSKRRPALVVGLAEFDDVILCQITSKRYASKLAIRLTAADFVSGGLPVASYIRPDKLFTASRALVDKTHGVLGAEHHGRVREALQKIFL